MESERRRANPDELLKKINQQDQVCGKGHFKIFFGYAAGVGKTYAMLEAAHKAKARGVDVLAGYVEPHTRPETMALLEGLEHLSEQVIQHKGITMKEFDLDAAIRRKPQLILVDELAHTNADGCRHTKRYQDIEELIKAGIDVYTTVNVQHIESLNDVIASITSVVVRERIPDSVFDNADQVELVDVEPEELMQRLKGGKVYKTAQAEQALNHFFDIKNLTALREIALRRCADRINRMSEKVRTQQNESYYTDERILVCLSSSPTSAKIIRTAARMAGAFRGSFSALFVETSDSRSMGEEDKNQLRINTRLAQQLGATVETVYGDDVPFQIAEFARLTGVSKVVMGRSTIQRKYFWNKPSLTERLIALAPNLDVYIIPDQSTPSYRAKRGVRKTERFEALDIVKTTLLLAGTTLLGWLFHNLGFSEANIITVYILNVLLTSLVTKQRAFSLISSLASVVLFNFFFTEPYFTLKVYASGYPVTFLIMFLSAFITGTLAVRMKRQTKQASEAAYRTKILLETNQLIQKGKGQEAIARVVAGQMIKLLSRDIVIYLVENQIMREPMIFMAQEGADTSEYQTPNEKAVAEWVYKNNKHAGATTNTLCNAKCLYLAIRAGDAVYGVVGIAIPDAAPDALESSIMLSMLGECALAMENEAALREREQSALMAKNEQLRANLLRSISHDLRTPLTSISGNASVLVAGGAKMSEESRKNHALAIYDDSMWLINLVENLLAVTRIEDGSMKLRLSTELMDDVIAEAMHHIDRRSEEHEIIYRPSETFLMAKMDARLIVQVVINIVDNAIKYTSKGSQIVVTPYKQANKIVVDIADNGEGISDEAKKRVFEMFYTIGHGIADSRRGLGLGLALCKSIIAAHGGEISVMDNHPKGTIVRFEIPAEEVILRE